MRGGVSIPYSKLYLSHLYSPHAWGCFLIYLCLSFFDLVFPTCDGGVSSIFFTYTVYLLYSPHAWGCFLHQLMKLVHKVVFPTCVGVFPAMAMLQQKKSSIPHMRGGVSEVANRDINKIIQRIPHMRGGVSTGKGNLVNISLYSPHAWGCSYSNH